MAFSDEIKRKIIADNLRTQERGISASLEARRSHLSDLATLLLKPYRERPITLDDLHAMGEDAMLTSGEVGIHREVREDVREGIVASMIAVLAYDRATLSTLLSTHLGQMGQPLSQSFFLSHTAPVPRIAYVRNAYTDEAFDAFSASVEDATSLFADHYEDACTELLEGAAGYAILPWRDTRGEYHRATLTLLEAHDLSVVSTVTVTDGEDIPMQYALVTGAPSPVKGAWEMLLALPAEWLARMAELTATLPLLDVCLAGTLYDAAGDRLYLTLRGRGDTTSLMIWLSMFAPAYHFMAYYPNIKELES